MYKVHDFINDISSIEGQICQITYTLQQRGSLSHRTEREGKKKERKKNKFEQADATMVALLLINAKL